MNNVKRALREGKFTDLAASLYAGSVLLDDVSVVLAPGTIPDEAYHRFRVQQALNDARTIRMDPVWWAAYAELRDRFELVYIEGVEQWLRN
jgi:hypothetical protein